MDHNEIVLQLNNETLALLLYKQFGDQGCWSAFHWVVNQEIKDWNINGMMQLCQVIEKRKDMGNDLSLEHIKQIFTASRNFIQKLSIVDSLRIEKTFEYPVIKGEGQYMATKGFIDLIVHCHPITDTVFSTYQQSNDSKEFIIEIKTEKDFKDFGAILRQIKEYKEYYNSWGVQRWTTTLIPENSYDNKNRKYCILSKSIPQDIKTIFENEKILCLELDGLNQEKFD